MKNKFPISRFNFVLLKKLNLQNIVFRNVYFFTILLFDFVDRIVFMSSHTVDSANLSNFFCQGLRRVTGKKQTFEL